MNIKTAPVVRQDTFIIEIDSASESCQQHRNIVVPVIEEPLSSSRISGHISRNNSLTSITTKKNFTRRNRTNEGNNQASNSNNALLEKTVISKTLLFESPEFGASVRFSSSVRKKLRREQQTRRVSNTLSSSDLSREESIAGDNPSHPAYRGEPHISATVTPDPATGRSETIFVDNYKVRQTVPLNSNPDIPPDNSPVKSRLNNVVNVFKSDYGSRSFENIRHIHPGRLESHARPAHAAAGKSSQKVHLDCSTLGRKSQFGEDNIFSSGSLENKVSQLRGCGAVDADRPATVRADKSWPYTAPQTSRVQCVLASGREPGVIGRAECYSHHTRRDLTPSEETSNKLTGNITSLTRQEVTSRMARADRFNDGQERFEDVLKERNDMMESERVYRKRIRQLEEELKGMVNQCQVLSNENKELRKTLDGIKRPDKNSDNLDALAKVTKLESEKANLLASHEAKLKQMDSLFSENTKLKSENAELERKVGELDKQLISLQYDNAQIHELQAAISGLKSENKTLDNKGKSLERAKEALANSLENKMKELDELTRALQTEADTAVNLKQAGEKLERAELDNAHIKEELTDLMKMLTNSETMKQTLQEQVTEGEDAIGKLTLDIDKKDTLIRELRSDLDISRQEILKIEDSQHAFKDVEKEMTDLRSRIGFLKADLDSSREENQGLKQDREEMVLTIEKLGQEKSAESGNESVAYLLSWEQEKQHRVRIEADLVKKKEEVRSLEARLNEADNKVAELGKRLKYLEDKGGYLGVSGSDELETDKKALKDGNMKLRQMLVERNIQLTNTRHEQTIADSLIRSLELKQKKAEVRVQQLSQRIGNASQNTGQDIKSSGASKVLPASPDRISKPLEPIKNSQSMKSSRSHIQERPGHRSRNLHAVGPLQTVHPGSQEHRDNVQQGPTLGRANKLGGAEVHQAASGLLPLATMPVNDPHSSSGYFALYKFKQKRFQEKGY